MAKLTAIEKETIILFNETDNIVEVYTYNGRIKRKIEKARAAAPTQYRRIRDDGNGGVTYQFPKSLFSVRFKVPISDEKRQELSNRAYRTKPHLSHVNPQTFDESQVPPDGLPTQPE